MTVANADIFEGSNAAKGVKQAPGPESLESTVKVWNAS